MKFLLRLMGFVVVMGWVGMLSAQSNAPPTITRFTSDLASITVDDAEGGAQIATLSWSTVGMVGDQRLALDTYSQRRWSPLLDTASQPLQSSGLYVVRVQNLCGFCPPTFRLAIVDARGQILDQQIVTIPFDTDSVKDKPTIESFTTGVLRIDANALAQRTARIPVLWQLKNRLPDANLIFEQVMDDGSILPVELPRADWWVASNGQGEVVPGLPQTENLVKIRARLINVTDGSVYDEKLLTIPLIGSPTAPVINTVQLPPAQIPGTGEYAAFPVEPPPSQAQIFQFTVNPQVVERGGTVTVNWVVNNARAVLVARLGMDGQFADIFPSPQPAGSWVITLPTYHVDVAQFYLTAIDAQDNALSTTLTVQVLCPYTYFFGTDAALGCPLSGFTDVQALYQPFDGGFMIWRGDTRQVDVFYTNGQHFAVYPDTWQEGETVNVQGTPPEGRFAPTGRLAKVWLNTAEVMGGLGWATAPEQPFEMRVQQTGDQRYPRTYLTLPDQVVIFAVESDWRYLGQQQ